MCDDHDGNTKHYYTFHYILDDKYNGTKQLSLQLEGSTDSFDPFLLTGWSGVVGNSRLDPDMVKGYTFEFNIDYQGSLSSFATGAITISDIETVEYNASIDAEVGDSICIPETGIAYNGFSPVFKKKEFVGARW